MNDSHPNLLSKIHRLELLLVVTFLFALVPWAGLGYAAWKFSQPEIRLGDKLVAQSIDLRSNDGATLVRLSADNFGGNLQLSTPEGKAIVKVIAGANGGDVTLMARDGGKFAHLGSGAGKGASLLLNGANGKQTVYLGSEDDNSGNLSLNNKSGEISVVLRDNDGHGGSISTYKDRNHVLAYFGAGPTRGGAFQLFDGEGVGVGRMIVDDDDQCGLEVGADGRGTVSIGAAGDKVPFVALRSADGKGFAEMRSTKQGGFWHLGDERGHVRARAGWCKDGNESIEVDGPDEKLVATLCDSNTGGYFQTRARNGNTTFQAGCDDREGAGLISLYHVNGPMIFAAGMSFDDSSGIINVLDLTGKMILRAP